MDPFTEKLLEKTRQRREQLQQKLQSTPSSATRKRKPLQVDTSQNTADPPSTNGSEKVGEKRRKSLKTSNSSLNHVSNDAHQGSENQVDAGTGPAAGVARKMSVGAKSSSLDLPSPKPATRKGRLQMLAAQINDWEDDLSHPHPAKKESPTKQKQHPSGSAPAPRTAAADSDSQDNPAATAAAFKPPKPPRVFQTNSAVSKESAATCSSPRFTRQVGNKEVNDAFSFGSAPAKSSPARPSKPPTPHSNQSPAKTKSISTSDEEPTKKAVADRFSMWEKRTGDSLAPLRQATPLRGAMAKPAAATSSTKATPAGQSVRQPASLPASTQARAAEFKPSEVQPAKGRRRSRSAAAATPEREHTGASAPWNKPAALTGSATKPVTSTPARQTATPRQQKEVSNDNEWCKTQDHAFQKAPMSARKSAWEIKIAEQQNVAEEHNRVMYRTRSATRLGGTSCQKQQAEDLLRQGQERVYDPAERARKERQAELESLQNRFNNKGLLKQSDLDPQTTVSNNQSAANTKPIATSMESLEDQEYFTASDSELNIPSSSNNATAGSSADEMKGHYGNKRQVSFKSPTRAAERRKSESPPESDQDCERKIQRRSSCRIPTLGYDSSSSEEEMTPKPKLFALSPGRGGGNRGSPNKIPRLGDESSADSLDEMRQISGSSIGSSVSSYSYNFVAAAEDPSTPVHNTRDVVDFLDEAMSDDESSPSPRRQSPSPRRLSPERRETRSSRRDLKSSTSSAGLYSVDQYRQKTKSMAQLPTNMSVVRRPHSAYDTDDSSIPDSITSSSQYSFSESDRRKRVKELQLLVQQEQIVIGQSSNALNQCCKAGSSFAGSKEQVECNKLLLIACQRRQAYLSEIEVIKANPHSYERRKGKGSLTISDIQLPLKREFVKKIGTPEDDTEHYFLLMVRAGPQVIVTQMVSTCDTLMRGSLHFPNLIKLNDIMNDFKYELEIYGMQVSRESSVKQSGKKDKKKGGSMSRAQRKATIGRDNSASSAIVRTTSFTHITSLMLTMNCIKHTSFQLSRVPYLSPLQGTVNMFLRCTMEANVIFKGFINMFEDVGGFGAWHRRWCVLNNHTVSYWKYPDDELVREPVGQLTLKDCVTEEVRLVSRDKCARPNTIELLIVRPASKGDSESGRNRQIRDRMLYEQHWFGMDTKADRLEWCSKLNEALANVRQWYSDASRPVPSKKMEI